jgi:hypothetical protein
MLPYIRAVEAGWIVLELQDLSEAEAGFIGKFLCPSELRVKSYKRNAFN